MIFRLRFYLKVCLFVLALLSGQQSEGQVITGIETSWENRFDEWRIYTLGDSLEGSLELTWKFEDDWGQWSFHLGELSGTAKIKFSNDPGLWEFRAANEIITAKTIWSNDYTSWRFSNGHKNIKLKSKYKDWPGLWFSEGEDYGYLDIYLEYEDDPNIWIVEDFLDEDISVLYRLALVIIPIIHSSPQER